MKIGDAITFLLPIAVLSGCASGRMVTIGSEPPGATVVADGKAIGETPVKFHQDEAFPPRWIGSSYMVKGTLALEKEGCKRFSMPVDDKALSEDIQITLQCAPVAMNSSSPAAADTEQAAHLDSSPAAQQAGPHVVANVPTVEKRLLDLKHLYDQGLITDIEYAQQRKRILDSI